MASAAAAIAMPAGTYERAGQRGPGRLHRLHAGDVQAQCLAAVSAHGSVTEAAKVLHYSQPSVSHHLARLEAATGARLIQRVGRGIRLTPEGELLARRATEIVGRVDAAGAELAAQLGLRTGRVRLAAFSSA